MKKIVMFLILSLFGSLFLFSQEETDSIPTPHKQIVRMGGAGGFTPLLLFWDVKNINESMSSMPQFPHFKDQPMVLLGGQGYGYIMFIQNLRIGGMGAGGSQSSSVVGLDGYRRDADIDISFGGGTVEYSIPITERFDLVPGIMLGGGGIDLNLRKDKPSNKIWNELINEYGSSDSTGNFRRTFKGSFFIFQPSLNFEYALLRWVGLRVGVSYVGMISPTWKLDDAFDVVSVPDKLSGKGLMINAGVFLGTFLF
jgi:hypothetical protein